MAGKGFCVYVDEYGSRFVSVTDAPGFAHDGAQDGGAQDGGARDGVARNDASAIAAAFAFAAAHSTEASPVAVHFPAGEYRWRGLSKLMNERDNNQAAEQQTSEEIAPPDKPK